MLFALAGAAASPAGASPDGRAQAEIDYLLDYVAASGCSFIRDGRAFPGTEARAHLERKYSYARSSLTAAEQFITEVASASSVTGEPYGVRCPAVETNAGPWLTAALKRYRALR
jgi:hypothetical protein